MFITLTIDTNQKRQNKRVRFSAKKFDPTAGWKKSINKRKRSLLQRLQALKRSFGRTGQYKLNGNVAMF